MLGRVSSSTLTSEHTQRPVISVTLSSPNSFITSAQRQWYFHKARKYNPISTVLLIVEIIPIHLCPQTSSQLIQSLAFAVNESTWWIPRFDLFLTLSYIIALHSYINFTGFSSSTPPWDLSFINFTFYCLWHIKKTYYFRNYALLKINLTFHFLSSWLVINLLVHRSNTVCCSSEDFF